MTLEVVIAVLLVTAIVLFVLYCLADRFLSPLRTAQRLCKRAAKFELSGRASEKSGRWRGSPTQEEV
jgi:hypothetical protein